MPLQLPQYISVSINPLLQSMGDLLEEYSDWHRFLPWNWGRTHFEEVATLVASIRTGNIDSSGVIACLRDGVLAGNPVMQGYLADIQAGLVQYLTRCNPVGWNTLMLTTCSQPEAVALLTAAMNDLSQDQRYTILSQVNWNGWNALMFASGDQPEAVAPLFTAMNGLRQEQRNAILSRTNASGWNALMVAADHQPEAVGPLIAAMHSLSPDQRYAILSKADSNGWNALTLAARRHPEAVAPLIRAMNGLSQYQRYVILSKANSDEWNALMHATRYHPQAVDPLIRAMNNLNQYQRYAILSKANWNGWNALMLAAVHQPEAISLLAAAMSDLSPDQRYAIFSKTNNSDGLNAERLAQQVGNNARANLVRNAMIENGRASLQPTQVAGQSASSNLRFFQPNRELIKKLKDLTLFQDWIQEGNSPKIYVVSADPKSINITYKELLALNVMDVGIKFIRGIGYKLTCSAIDTNALLAINLKSNTTKLRPELG